MLCSPIFAAEQTHTAEDQNSPHNGQDNNQDYAEDGYRLLWALADYLLTVMKRWICQVGENFLVGLEAAPVEALGPGVECEQR